MLAALAAHAQNMPVAQIADPHGVARPENLRHVLFMFHMTLVRRKRRVVKRKQRFRTGEATVRGATCAIKYTMKSTGLTIFDTKT